MRPSIKSSVGDAVLFLLTAFIFFTAICTVLVGLSILLEMIWP